jgi:hypothetical protein
MSRTTCCQSRSKQGMCGCPSPSLAMLSADAVLNRNAPDQGRGRSCAIDFYRRSASRIRDQRSPGAKTIGELRPWSHRCCQGGRALGKRECPHGRPLIRGIGGLLPVIRGVRDGVTELGRDADRIRAVDCELRRVRTSAVAIDRGTVRQNQGRHRVYMSSEP